MSKHASSVSGGISIGSQIHGVLIACALAGLGVASLALNTPVHPHITYDETRPLEIVVYMIPGLAHLITACVLILLVGLWLRSRASSTQTIAAAYIAVSVIWLLVYGLLIFSPPHKDVVQRTWSGGLFPHSQLTDAVGSSIRRSVEKSDLSICELLDSPQKSRLLTGVTRNGDVFKVYPGKTFALEAMGGKIPVMCMRKELYAAAKNSAKYYEELSWFSKECNASSLDEKCDFTQKNLLKYSAPQQPVWHQGRFLSTAQGSILEFVAVPGKGVLMTKTLPVAANTIRIEEAKKYREAAEKIHTYRIQHFKCSHASYAELSASWDSLAAPFGNRLLDADELRYWNIAPTDLALSEKMSLACGQVATQ